MMDFKTVSVFHFGAVDQGCPVSALREQIEHHGEKLKGSLLVLPEGFNVPDGYNDGTGPTPSIVQNLFKFSERHELAFVAGLIGGIGYRSHENPPPYNSSYLIDVSLESKYRLLSQKKIDCRPGLCYEQADFVSKPFVYRGFGIASLICNDFIKCGLAEKNTLIQHPDWIECDRKILCVPACCSFGRTLWEVATDCCGPNWASRVCVAAANSSRDYSFVEGIGFTTKHLPGWQSLYARFDRNVILISEPEAVSATGTSVDTPTGNHPINSNGS